MPSLLRLPGQGRLAFHPHPNGGLPVCRGRAIMMLEENAMKLDVKALALSCGLIWGLGLFLVTWWVILLDGSSGEITWLGHVYRGYNISAVGSVIGAAWGFVDGAIGGAILALVYNKLRKPEETEAD